MRIRKRENLRKKNSVITFLFLLPMIGFGVYLGVGIYILNDLASYTYQMDPPNTDRFYSMDEINNTELYNLAQFYEWQMERYHTNGTGIPVAVTFEDSDYDEVDRWHGTDNGALHLCYYTAAEAHRYKWALENENWDEYNEAKRLLKKTVKAWSDMLAAPNGGIGPDYPGTLPRFVSSFGNKKYHDWLFQEHEKHFNGTGDYEHWRVRLLTSRDELAGYILGFSTVLWAVDPDQDDDSKWMVDRIKLLTEQMIEGFRKTNWLILGGYGEPVGSDVNPIFEGSTWQLAVMRIGATANPAKYDKLYHYVAAKSLSYGGANMGSAWNTYEDTYALSFGMDVIYSLVILEDDPKLQYHYIKNFETQFYDYVRYHRNAFYNMVHLAFMDILKKDQREQFENSDYDDDDVEWDILDQLWRYKVSGWEKGVRNYNLTDRPHSTRSTSLNPEIADKERVPSKKKWRDFFENTMLGKLYGWMADEDLDLFDFSEDSEMYMLPLTVSEYGIHHWVFEHSKFHGEGGNPTGDGLTEDAPNSYLCIYWMLQAYDYL